MNNTKKILFAGSLALALSAGVIIPTNVNADTENTVANSEEKAEEFVQLDFIFELDGDLSSVDLDPNNNIAYINGVPYTTHMFGHVLRYKAKRGTTLKIELKRTAEKGSKVQAVGEFYVPEEGFSGLGAITVKVKPVDNKDTEEEKPNNPEDKPKDKDNENNTNPGDGKPDDKEDTKPDGENTDKPDKEDSKPEDNKGDEEVENKTYTPSDGGVDENEAIHFYKNKLTIIVPHKTVKDISQVNEDLYKGQIKVGEEGTKFNYQVLVDSKEKLQNNSYRVPIKITDVEGREGDTYIAYGYVRIEDNKSDGNGSNIDKNDKNDNTDGKNDNSKKENSNFDFPIFDTESEARDAAEEYLLTSKDFDSYTIKKTSDGKYYYHLEKKANNKVEAPKKVTKTQITKANEVKVATAKPSSNVKTGVTGLSGLVGVFVAAVGGYFFTKKNK